MTGGAHAAWLQVTAGQGPAECAWAAMLTGKEIMADAAGRGLRAEIIGCVPGPEAGTAQSILIGLAAGDALPDLLASWSGTVLWIARSPFRPDHRRKNWFVGVMPLEPVAEAEFDMSDLRIETMRARGAGGQHVNRTESAVRVTHLATGLQASASEERSQHTNRKLALARLRQKLADRAAAEAGKQGDLRWRAHRELARGNPVRTFRA